jgi:hypothetical protein
VSESTLRPGKISPSIRKLREAAISEMDAIPSGVVKPKPVKFDHDHKSTPQPDIQSQADFDAKNSVARFAGLNSPHVGNGSGGVR